NGSGKTTLMSFLLSVMFGLPNTRRKNARNYDTNDNMKYGDRLYLTNTKYGDVMIERTKTNGKQQLTYTINEGEKQVTNDVSFLWNDLSKRSEERRVGKECKTLRSQYHKRKKKNNRE